MASLSINISSHPQRRAAACRSAELLAFLPDHRVEFLAELGRERAFADTGGIRFSDAQDLVDRCRGNAGPDTAASRCGRRGCNERIGPEIDIQESALRAFEQDILALGDDLIQINAGILDERRKPFSE
jgi:hypothetical protein